jgi:DNA primase
VGHATDPRVVDKLRRFDAFVIATDADTAGDRAYAVISSVLTDRRVVRARPPEGFDANEMEPSALRALVEAAL